MNRFVGEPDWISSCEEARENIKRFNADLKSSGDSGDFLARKLAQHYHWYYDEASGLFGPSKFIGYRGMTAGRYSQAEPKHGGHTQKALAPFSRPVPPVQYLELRNRLDHIMSANGKKANRRTKLHLLVCP